MGGDKRYPLRKVFDKALQRVTPAKEPPRLMQKFHERKEGVDFKLPIKSTPEMKRFCLPEKRTGKGTPRESPCSAARDGQGA